MWAGILISLVHNYYDYYTISSNIFLQSSPPIVAVCLTPSCGWWPSSQLTQRGRTAWPAGQPYLSPQHWRPDPLWSLSAAWLFPPAHSESLLSDPEEENSCREVEYWRLTDFRFYRYRAAIPNSIPTFLEAIETMMLKNNVLLYTTIT